MDPLALGQEAMVDLTVPRVFRRKSNKKGVTFLTSMAENRVSVN